MTRLGFDGDEGNDVQLDDVFYRFPLASGPESFLHSSFEPRDFLDVASPVVSSGEGAVPDLVALIRSCGYRMRVRGLVDLEFGDALSGGYLSPTDVASDPSETNGLFNGSYSACQPSL